MMFQVSSVLTVSTIKRQEAFAFKNEFIKNLNIIRDKNMEMDSTHIPLHSDGMVLYNTCSWTTDKKMMDKILCTFEQLYISR